MPVVLRVLEYIIACAHSYDMWHIMDSHARDSTVMIDDQGSSVVLQFPDYMSLLHYNRCFFENAASERVINQLLDSKYTKAEKAYDHITIK